MSNKKDSKNTNESSSENATGSRFTVTAESNFGQYAWHASHEVSAEVYAELANEGFKSLIQDASSKLDPTPEFGNFGHKVDGKIVKRSDSYKRGEIAYVPEKAEVVRQFLATQPLDNDVIPVTVSRYESTAVKAVTVDQASLVVAKAAINKRAGNAEKLVELANMVKFEFTDASELVVENDSFIQKICAFYAQL